MYVLQYFLVTSFFYALIGVISYTQHYFGLKDERNILNLLDSSPYLKPKQKTLPKHCFFMAFLLVVLGVLVETIIQILIFILTF
jgi:hypothetical protein